MVRPARREDAAALSPCPESLLELEFAGNPSLADGVSNSSPCWAGLIDGRVVALFGVGPGRTAWLIHAGLPRRVLARHGRVWLARMLRDRGALWNVVPAGSVAERWLRALGADVGQPVVPAGPRPFLYFVLPTSILDRACAPPSP